jgi:hypothetical protein
VVAEAVEAAVVEAEAEAAVAEAVVVVVEVAAEVAEVAEVVAVVVEAAVVEVADLPRSRSQSSSEDGSCSGRGRCRPS